MSDHPHVMLSDRALANFSRFIKANPNGPPRNPSGAFDAMPARLSRHRRRDDLRVSDFERGGAFDEGGDISALNTIDEGQASALLEYLNGKLSDDDLEALRAMLNENSQSAIEGQPTFSGGSDARNRRIATDVMIARDGRQNKRAAALFPELARIRIA